MTDDEPNLGLATTKQLLEELKARGEVSVTIGQEVTEATIMVVLAGHLLRTLSYPMLHYRTVDS
jgi:hypothetical protein